MVSSYAMTSSLKETISLLDPPSCANTPKVPINKTSTSNKMIPVPKEKSVPIPDTLFLITLYVVLMAFVVF